MAGKTIFQLNPKAQRRFERGHPWVFSNEIKAVPKTMQNGEIVELRDSRDKFLAWGFGNRNSLICFRRLSLAIADRERLLRNDFWIEKLVQAAQLREALGLSEYSHRLCFGEGDGIPGLIIDRYKLEAGQVFVCQAQTAG